MDKSIFFAAANEALFNECKRLDYLTDQLDKDPAEKKKQIAEYKCAKYRWASVAFIHSILWNNNRICRERDLKDSHYLIGAFDEIFKKHDDYLALYESAPEEEKPDYSLYYLATAIAEEKLEELESKLLLASDWESIELEERIGGLKFAKECLDDAWQKRKGDNQ